jgi:hypothetical protein
LPLVVWPRDRFVLDRQGIGAPGCAGRVAAFLLGFLPGVVLAGIDSWTLSGPPAPSNISSLIPDPGSPSSLYAGAFGPVLFRLSDGRWTMVADGSGGPTPVPSIAIDPLDAKTIYVGVASNLIPPTQGGIYKSTDSGKTWLFVDVYQGYPVSRVVVDPAVEGTVYTVVEFCYCAGYCGLPRVGCSGVLFKSNDGGVTWFRMGLGGITALAITPDPPSILYALASQGIVSSRDGGLTWTLLVTSFGYCYPSGLAPGPSSSGTLYVTIGDAYGCPAALFKTADFGSSWTPTGLGPDEAVGALAVDPTDADVVYVVGDRLLRSTDGGTTWIPFDAGLPRSTVDLIAVDRDGGGLHVYLRGRGVFDYRFLSRSPTPPAPRVIGFR